MSLDLKLIPLKTWLMNPYPGTNLSDQETKAVFNYRLSRCRRTIENTFGIYVVRFPIFLGPVIKATVCLHNYLRLTGNAHYTPTDCIDSGDSSGYIIRGEWRQVAGISNNVLQPVLSLNGEKIHLSCKRCKREIQLIFQQQRGFSSTATATCSRD